MAAKYYTKENDKWVEVHDLEKIEIIKKESGYEENEINNKMEMKLNKRKESLEKYNKFIESQHKYKKLYYEVVYGTSENMPIQQYQDSISIEPRQSLWDGSLEDSIEIDVFFREHINYLR